MRDEKLGIGIIGVGQIGKKHLETYLSMPGIRVEEIAGKDPLRTKSVADTYHIAKWSTDFHRLLENPKIQAVSVCVHNNLHAPISIEAMRAGKHVLCEKPIAGTYLDGLSMYEASVSCKRHLAIQLSDLFTPETQAALHAIRQGWVGKPYLAHASGFRRRGRPFVDGYGTPSFVQKEKAGGGVLFDLGVYHIANILYLLENPKPGRICGRIYQKTEMDEERRKISQFDVEEIAIGWVSLSGDITLTINESWAIHLDQWESSYISGADGGVRLRPFGLFRSFGDLEINASADLEAFQFRMNHIRGEAEAYLDPIHHFVASIQEKVSPIPTAELALNTMLISEGIYLSQQLDHEVTSQEVISRSTSTSIDLD